eukprot:TRINITY_DN2364_c0_g1_i1.p2 TRINITY_DN2364_c0_g1~~TRINITY_DN2364_c0_g1_i1.p2  ORF type:complete len:122 (+),score=34.64 TRINITY_DN2364_c0_g1_i1:82-447(+)
MIFGLVQWDDDGIFVVFVVNIIFALLVILIFSIVRRYDNVRTLGFQKLKEASEDDEESETGGDRFEGKKDSHELENVHWPAPSLSPAAAKNMRKKKKKELAKKKKFRKKRTGTIHPRLQHW